MKNTEKLKKFVLYMRAKNMAENTIKTYYNVLTPFLEVLNKDSVRISKEDIQNYIFNIPDKYSNSYRNQVVNALKLYFQVIENKVIDARYTPRPIKQQYIPNVLGRSEIEDIIRNTSNLKHRAILFTIYDNGLRISELINLRVCDVETKNGSSHLIIKNAKHHKSRIIPLSQRCLDLLRKYYTKYKPTEYLFPGTNGKYSATSIRNIFHNALRKQGITKRLRVHDLRHSFATECLKNETNIHHLSQVLGHKSVKTTEKTYSHLNVDQLVIKR